MAIQSAANTRTNDEIRKDVQSAILWEPQLANADIGVAVSDGVVTLTGFVPRLWMKAEAEKAAKNVYGVRAVANDIEVRLGSERTDSEIARSAVDALERHVLIPSEKISVTVSHGRVTLEGEVGWQFQRKLAESTVGKLEGVRDIINKIRIKTNAPPEKIVRKIEEALQRSAQLDASKIAVEVEGSSVTLRGTVRSWSEKEEAEGAAWSAPGFTEVENLIEVVSEPRAKGKNHEYNGSRGVRPDAAQDERLAR